MTLYCRSRKVSHDAPQLHVGIPKGTVPPCHAWFRALRRGEHYCRQGRSSDGSRIRVVNSSGFLVQSLPRGETFEKCTLEFEVLFKEYSSETRQSHKGGVRTADSMMKSVDLELVSTFTSPLPLNTSYSKVPSSRPHHWVSVNNASHRVINPITRHFQDDENPLREGLKQVSSQFELLPAPPWSKS